MPKDKLPDIISVFPLSNAIFFPRTILPLNIFEDRYLQLVEDCMQEKRMFGMVQPKIKSSKSPEVYNVGCLGKIINFNETNDGRFIINLSGITRFKIKEEVNSKKLYRKFKVDYSDFSQDLDNKNSEIKNYNKDHLLKKIKLFFNKINYSVGVNELEQLNFDQLISTVCMILPFTAIEKQNLIEKITIEDKVDALEKIINFNLVDLHENKTIQ